MGGEERGEGKAFLTPEGRVGAAAGGGGGGESAVRGAVGAAPGRALSAVPRPQPAVAGGEHGGKETRLEPLPGDQGLQVGGLLSI